MIQNIPSNFNHFPVYYNIGGSPEPPEPEPDYSTMPLTLSSINGTTTVQLSGQDYSPTVTLYYSINGGDWSNSIQKNHTAITLNDGDYISFSGSNAQFSSSEGNAINKFVLGGTGKQIVYGNIKSLLSNKTDTLTGEAGQFTYLFSDCSNLINAANLKLSYTTISWAGYSNMFKGCSSLIAAPELPATTFEGKYNYRNMFSGCTSLVQGPSVLPATTLTQQCYSEMFRSCASLKDAPIISATTLPGLNTMANMFYDCPSLSSITVAFTQWGSNDTSWWVYNTAFGGIFTKPSALAKEYNSNRIPDGWSLNEF